MKITNKTHRRLVQEAQEHGICAEWLADLKAVSDTRSLADMYMRGIDFCIIHDWPSPELIRQEIPDAGQYGIHAGEKGVCETDARHVALLAGTTAALTWDGYANGEVYVRHDSKADITAAGNSFVMVDIFDRAEVTVRASGRARICVNRYAEEGDGLPKVTAHAEPGATIRINEKKKRNYR